MENKAKKKKLLLYSGSGILAVIFLAASAFLIWATTPSIPEQNALDAVRSAQTIDDENWLVFSPDDFIPATGLVFYPGGRVDYRAYAAHAKDIAEAGFTVVVVPMPLNFAFLGTNRAENVMAAFPQIKTWAVGGHSLGGAMAAEFAKSNPSLVDGLVLWASYPAENTDFSRTDLPVLSIYASNDKIASLEEIEVSKMRLPDETLFYEIEGGNHAGFGWYGPQNGDGVLDILKSDQQQQIAVVTIEFLQELGR